MILLKDGNTCFEIYSNIINNKNIYYLKFTYINEIRILLYNKYLIYKLLYSLKNLLINLNKDKYKIGIIEIKISRNLKDSNLCLVINLSPKYPFFRYYCIEYTKDLLICYIELLLEKIIKNDIIKE